MNKVNEANFQSEVLDSPVPVLVDFSAEWCGPCKMLLPVLERLEQNRKDIKIVKVDIDDNTNLCVKHKISSVPTMMFVKNGQVVKRLLGVLNESQLNAEIDVVVSSS